jgi:HEAT repeat protein
MRKQYNYWWLNVFVFISFGIIACTSTSTLNSNEIYTIVKALGDESTRETAYNQLSDIGAPALPSLVEAIASDTNVEVRRHAVILTFGMLSIHPKTMNQVRSSPNDIPPLVEKLIPALSDPDEMVRNGIPDLLQGFSLFAGPEIFQQKILPQLEQAQKSENELIREGVEESLKKLPPIFFPATNN